MHLAMFCLSSGTPPPLLIKDQTFFMPSLKISACWEKKKGCENMQFCKTRNFWKNLHNFIHSVILIYFSPCKRIDILHCLFLVKGAITQVHICLHGASRANGCPFVLLALSMQMSKMSGLHRE